MVDAALQINPSLCSALTTCDCEYGGFTGFWLWTYALASSIDFGAHHPVNGKIYQILPVDLLLGDVIPSRTHAASMVLANILLNPSIAGVYMRKFPLLSKLLQHR